MYEDHAEVLVPLLALKLDPNYRDNRGRSYLDLAIHSDNKDVMEVLVDSKKLNLDSQDPEGNTALHLAVINVKPALAQVLINGGASKKIKNKKGQTPLELAKQDKNKKLLELLK